ncbi:MAG: M55 family metallopeptidase [Lentisphaeria bacterium]|jgi:D-amino peptidase|nr:M55 family metallopeptidase [Lentisphaeria bacterium]
MKFMIRCDVEGVTGVTTYHQAERTAFGRDMLMNDLNATIAGLLATGDHEIVVYDEHTDGRNVLLDQLPDAVSVICGKPLYRAEWGGIDASFDAMLMVGFHARAGVPGALLPHSYSLRNLRLAVNDFELGEIGMEAAVAGDFGIPVWLVTGDSAGMAEAEAILPGVRTVTVKEAMGESAALCHSPRRTARLIEQAAREIVASPPPVQPLSFSHPAKLDIRIEEGPFLQALRELCPDSFVGLQELRFMADTVTAAWSDFLHLQAEAERILAARPEVI